METPDFPWAAMAYAVPMLNFEEAQSLLDANEVQERVESISMAAGMAGLLGRILAEPITAKSDQPPFDRSTMDGYAVRLSGESNRFQVIGTVTAGQEYLGEVSEGQAIRIMTGAPCPKGLTVVPVERTDDADHTVVIEKEALVANRNIAWQGQDAKRGDAVMGPGCRLGPTTLSSAAMAGATSLKCFVPPRVGIVTTGDEIGADGPAGVRNSNGPLLEAFCTTLAVPVERHHVPDQEPALRQTLDGCRGRSEILVTVGGVSMGSRDLIPDIAGQLGFVPQFHHVAMKPGKPVYLGRHADGTFLLGLPGNPVSVLMTAHLFLAPLAGLFMGKWRPQPLRLPLVRDLDVSGNRRLFLAARFENGGVAPVDWNGSGDFYAAAFADGFIDLAPSSSWKAGDVVEFQPFLGHLPGETGLRPGHTETTGDCC